MNQQEKDWRLVELGIATEAAVRAILEDPVDGFDPMLEGPPSNSSPCFHGWRDEDGNLRFDWNEEKLAEAIDRAALATRGSVFEGGDRDQAAKMVAALLSRAFTKAMRLEGVSLD